MFTNEQLKQLIQGEMIGEVFLFKANIATIFREPREYLI